MANDSSIGMVLDSTVTTAPTGANVITIFDSDAAWGTDMLPCLPIKRISFTVTNDQTGTLKAYRKAKGGSYEQYDSQTVAASTATAVNGPYDYLVDTFYAWKLTWTNGGSNQTTWAPELHGHENRVPGT